jgi:integrase
VLLFFVSEKRSTRFLDSPVLSGVQVAEALNHRAITDGTPVFLDPDSMRPVEPWCTWGRHVAYQNRAASTMKKTARAILRLDDFARARGKDLLSISEWDLKAYELTRTVHQSKPIADTTWDNEMRLLDGVFTWLRDEGHIARRPVRPGPRGRNPLLHGLRYSMDVRHLTLEQYGYFRDVGLGGMLPDSRTARTFRGSSALRSRAAADLALSTGMRAQEWSTVLLAELGVGARRPGRSAVFELQACAKYGKHREVYVPPDTLDAVEFYLMLERPARVQESAKHLGRIHRELFVVGRIDPETGKVHGTLDGMDRVFTMEAMDPQLRRIAVREGEFGLEALAVFIGHGGQMVGPSRWWEIRRDAWNRMKAHADEGTPIMPDRRWRWHDLRHTFALQLLTYLEWQLDGMEPDAEARRRRHRTYLTEPLRRNPLLIVSRRLGHSHPETTYEYLQYADDPGTYLDAAFADWVADEEATYADIAAHVLGHGERANGVG